MLRAISKSTSFLTAESVLRKTLSLSACSPKEFVIKDHFDFDKKVTTMDLETIARSISRDYLFQVINSENAVIVNFHAEWCEPCKILTPKMTELLEDNPEIDFAIVDVDSNIEWVVLMTVNCFYLICERPRTFRLVNLFEVKAVPAVLAFRNGVVVDKFIGLVDANMIEDLITKLQRKKAVWDETRRVKLCCAQDDN